MSDASTPQMTDAPSTDAATTSPFTMVTGDPAAMVCEGDVCYIPGVGDGGGRTPSASDSVG